LSESIAATLKTSAAPSMPIAEIPTIEPLPLPAAPVIPWHERLTHTLQPYLPLMVGVWIFGVIALSIRHLFGWLLVQRMKRRYLDRIGERIQQQVTDLSERIRISRPVQVFQSTLASAPLTIGWIRPMILLPASALSGLSPAQIEAILAHELAHIRRFDYPINLLQTLVETFLFYHPAVWRLSKRIRIERENCCDDIAVEVCGDPVAYAKALAEVADLQSQPALAMSMGDGSLIDRVRRLIGKTREEEARSSAGWVSGVLAVIIVYGFMTIGMSGAEERDRPLAVDLAKSDEGQIRTVFNADGKPVADAQVYFLRPDEVLQIHNGIPERRDTSIVVNTDSEGRFDISGKDESDTIALFHKEGFSVIDSASLTNANYIVLREWGTIKGSMEKGGNPWVDQEVRLDVCTTSDLTGVMKPYIQLQSTAKSDKNGRFAFDRVVPGTRLVGIAVETYRFGGSFGTALSHMKRVEVTGGQTTQVTLGGAGRTVSGQVVLDQLGNSMVDLDQGFVDLDLKKGLLQQMLQGGSDEKTTLNYTARLNVDGSFQIEGVNPGTFSMEIEIRNPNPSGDHPRHRPIAT
ncbi:MAG: M48 family metalloprotease, partial [Candidatus Omnitrophica bacterium]|nr:M48 family metalloprotease [Candidatus Omnitrophota bacterium]